MSGSTCACTPSPFDGRPARLLAAKSMEHFRSAATLLLEPLALMSWVMLALNLMLWRRADTALLRWLCGLATVVFMLSASPYAANELQGWLEDRARALATCPSPPPRTVFVVLAGGLNGIAEDASDFGRMKDVTFRRTVAAVRIARRVPNSLLVMSGGAGERTREADVMKSLGEALGVPRESIFVERESGTTFDNARWVIPIVASLGNRPVYLVTSAMHMRRAAAVFRSTGQNICPYPVDFQRAEPEWADAAVPRTIAMLKTVECVREFVAYLVYRLQGRISPESNSAEGKK